MVQLVDSALGRYPSPYNVSGGHEATRATTVAEDGEMAEVWEGGEYSEVPAMPGRREE